jgi:hypothetical protein
LPELRWSGIHELRCLPDDVLKRTEVCVWYLHQVHDKYGAIDQDTHVKNSALLADVRAELERRGISARRECDR